jgi:glycosyltransferase involved in cell wall biosynthesis
MIKRTSSLPLVSIVVRTFGDRKFLAEEALRTIAYQTYRPVEVILVEDGTDGAADLLCGLESNGISSQYIQTPPRGRCFAGNAGLAAARGELMMFLDDDDGLFADHLETLVELAFKHQECPLVYSNSIEIFTQMISLSPLRYREAAFAPAYGNNVPFSARALRKHNLFPIQSAVFRRSVYEKCGGFDLELERLEDWNLWLRYLKAGDFAKSNRVTSFYRVPDRISDLGMRHIQHQKSRKQATAVAFGDDVGRSPHP